MEEYCKTQYTCSKCEWTIICDSSGKANTIDEQKKIKYVEGPCVCVTAIFGPCAHCGYTLGHNFKNRPANLNSVILYEDKDND